jgi:hypothetical protein
MRKISYEHVSNSDWLPHKHKNNLDNNKEEEEYGFYLILN